MTKPKISYADFKSMFSNSQVGGTHYKDMHIQPWEAMKAWMTPEEYIGYHKGTIISYIAREHKKGGVQDLYKGSHHYAELINFIGQQDHGYKKSD